MLGNYKSLASKIQQRLDPEGLPTFQKALSDELRSISYSDILTYIKTAMQGVSEEYTKRSIEAGKKVEGHLRRKLVDVSYEFQGSVMTNTHIEGYSDIDLLVITEKSYSYDSYTTNRYINDPSLKLKLQSHQLQLLISEAENTKYSGNQLQDLREIRTDSETVLTDTYDKCDTNQSKCITIYNKNLRKEVDTVIACWYDDLNSILNGKGTNRGIQIYHKHEHVKGNVDHPFLSIDLINQKSNLTNERLKKMIRFLKNVKSDSSLQIELSSFDLNAICYSIDIYTYINSDFKELIDILTRQLYTICNDDDFANSIKSVTNQEYIFKDKSDKLISARNLLSEVYSIYNDIHNVKQ